MILQLYLNGYDHDESCWNACALCSDWSLFCFFTQGCSHGVKLTALLSESNHKNIIFITLYKNYDNQYSP